MELVFFWCNEIENFKIPKGGISFSKEFYINYNVEKEEITIEKNENYANVYENNVITNINAVVGKNGVGKTSFFEEVSKDSYFHKHIQVFKISDKLYYSNGGNINNIKFVGEVCEEIKQHEHKLDKIFITNSYYVNEVKAKGYFPLRFSPKALDYRFDEFVDYIYGKDNESVMSDWDRTIKKVYKSIFRNWLENVENDPKALLDNLNYFQRKPSHKWFQGIFDLNLYNFLLNKKNDDHGKKEILGKDELKFSFEVYDYGYDYNEDYSGEKGYFSWISFMKKFYEGCVEKVNFSASCKELYCNLLTEIIYERFFVREDFKYLFYVLVYEEYILRIMKEEKIEEVYLPFVMLDIWKDKSFREKILEYETEVQEELMQEIGDYRGYDPGEVTRLYNEEQLLIEIDNYNRDAVEPGYNKYLIGLYQLIKEIENKDFDYLYNELKEEREYFKEAFGVLIQEGILNENFYDYVLFKNIITLNKNRYEIDFTSPSSVIEGLKVFNSEKTSEYMVEYFAKALEEIEELDAIIKNNSDNGVFEISYEKGKEILAFFNNQSSTNRKYPSFILRNIEAFKGFEMSSGERALTNLFSWVVNLYNFNTKDSENRNIILFIDELDLYLHPEWQRKIVEKIRDYGTEIFDGMKLQIIFSTHSPIILSDMINYNVVCLGNNEIIPNTFGANIHNILKHEFFLETTIGSYAKKEIEEINCLLDEKDENLDLDSIKKRINLIGEPIIKKALLSKHKELYKNYYAENLSKTIDAYKELNGEMKKEFINYIINEAEKNK